jgi:hypothetical protein
MAWVRQLGRAQQVAANMPARDRACGPLVRCADSYNGNQALQRGNRAATTPRLNGVRRSSRSPSMQEPPMKKPRSSLDDLLSLVVVAFALLCMSALLFELQAPTDTAAANVHPTTSHRA